jgi:hypothetical protein
LKASYL